MVGGEDVEQIKAKTEALAQVSMKLGEAMYKAQQEAGGRRCRRAGRWQPVAGRAPAVRTRRHDDKVVDADFEEVDDQKKRGSA